MDARMSACSHRNSSVPLTGLLALLTERSRNIYACVIFRTLSIVASPSFTLSAVWLSDTLSGVIWPTSEYPTNGPSTMLCELVNWLLATDVVNAGNESLPVFHAGARTVLETAAGVPTWCRAVTSTARTAVQSLHATTTQQLPTVAKQCGTLQLHAQSASNEPFSMRVSPIYQLGKL